MSHPAPTIFLKMASFWRGLDPCPAPCDAKQDDKTTRFSLRSPELGLFSRHYPV
jgi:hypothetical protein